MRRRVVAVAALVALCAPSLASAAVHKLTSDPNAEHPDIAVGEDGTAHVAWNQQSSGDDVLVYCRVPRGASGCAVTKTFKLPLGGATTRVALMPTGELVLTSERCCFPSARVYALTSTDSGGSFSAPQLLAERFYGWGGEVEPGPGNFSLSLVGGGGGCNDGVVFTAAPLEGTTTESIDLTGSCFNGEFYPSIGFIDPVSPMVAYRSWEGESVFYRRWAGSGAYNDLSNWLAAKQAATGDEAKLASGLRGVYLIYRDPKPPYDYFVRRYDTATDRFVDERMVSADDTSSAIFRDLFQDGGGTVHAVFLERPGAVWELRQAILRPGERKWSTPQKLATQKQTSDNFFNLRVGAAPDAGGAVVADGNGKGPIYFVPFAPTGGAGACAPTIKIGQAVVRALTGCFKKQKDGTRVAQGSVKVNGVDIEPVGGGASAARPGSTAAAFKVTADQKARTLRTSATADVRAGIVKLDRGKVAWKFPQGTGAVKRLVGPDPSVFKEIGKYSKKLFEFPVKGDAELLIGKGETAKIPTNFGLPSLIGGVSGAVTLNTTSAGLNLDKLQITAPQAAIGLLRISNIKVTYDGQNRFTGSATLELPPGYLKGINVAFGFVDGRLSYVHVDKSFTPMLPIIAPPYVGTEPIVGLDQLAFDYVDKAGSRKFIGSVLFVGGGKYIGLRAARLDGSVTLEFPASGPTTLDALGKLSVVGVPLGSAEVKYTVPDLVTFNGSFGVPVVGVSVSVNGWISVTKPPRFSAAGSLKLPLGQSAEAVISSQGWAGCLHFPQPPSPAPGIPPLGAHKKWGDLFPEMGCDVGAFKVAAPATPSGKVLTPWFSPAGRLGASSTAVRIPGGLPHAELEISGTGSAPRVSVTAPDGQTVTSGGGNVVQGRFIASELPEATKTYVAIGKPPKGAYTIDALPGSVPISGIRLARGLPDPKVSGRVSAKGRKRILRYRIRKIAGQKVTFAEQSGGLYRELASTKKASGKLVFRPTDSRRRKRRIVALVTENGFPRARLIVASFTAPKSRAPARPKVKVRRQGTKLVASWNRVKGARAYRVVVALPKDGRRLLRFLGARQTRLKVGGLEANDRGRVFVQALGDDARPGKAGKAKLKARKRRHR